MRGPSKAGDPNASSAYLAVDPLFSMRGAENAPLGAVMRLDWA